MTPYTIKTFKVRLNVSEAATDTARQSSDCYRILQPIFADLDADQEHGVVLSLNGQNEITGYKVISSGQMGSALIDNKLLFRALLALGGVAFILAHNHPSGEPRPSDCDKRLTRDVARAAKLMGYSFLDHLVLGAGRYYSFCDDGRMPTPEWLERQEEERR